MVLKLINKLLFSKHNLASPNKSFYVHENGSMRFSKALYNQSKQNLIDDAATKRFFEEKRKEQEKIERLKREDEENGTTRLNDYLIMLHGSSDDNYSHSDSCSNSCSSDD